MPLQRAKGEDQMPLTRYAAVFAALGVVRCMRRDHEQFRTADPHQDIEADDVGADDADRGERESYGRIPAGQEMDLRLQSTLSSETASPSSGSKRRPPLT